MFVRCTFVNHFFHNLGYRRFVITASRGPPSVSVWTLGCARGGIPVLTLISHSILQSVDNGSIINFACMYVVVLIKAVQCNRRLGTEECWTNLNLDAFFFPFLVLIMFYYCAFWHRLFHACAFSVLLFMCMYVCMYVWMHRANHCSFYY